MVAVNAVLLFEIDTGERIEYPIRSLSELETINKTYLSIYGRSISRRFVVNCETGEMFSKSDFISYAKKNKN